MCLAIFQPQGLLIPKEHFHTGWDNNHDGAGLLYHNGKHLDSFKVLRDFKEFLDAYEEANAKAQSGVITHFRRASVGTIDLDNCHPFVYSNLGFVHNGTIYNQWYKGDKSDTFWFGENIMSKLSLKVLRNKAVAELLRTYIGKSKLIIMDQQGATRIVNPEMGEVNKGIWYSNGEYRMLRNRLNLDYGYCVVCDRRLFGRMEQYKTICNDCYDDSRD